MSGKNMARILIIAIILLGLAAPAAAAIPACGKRPVIASGLEKEYGEVSRVIALTSNGLIVEFFVSPSGTWTLTLTAPGGNTCARVAGTSWQHVTPEPSKKDEY